MKKYFLFIILLMAQVSVMAGSDLTINDLSLFYAPQVQGVRPLADGESYARVTGDYKRIVRYSFKTGEELGVIFDVDDTRGSKVERLQDYIMSPDESKILIQTRTRHIYRHSFKAEFYIYDVASRKLAPLSQGGPQQVPVWSPDGSMVAFVRDNNIFLVKLLFGNAESQVTKDGKRNEVLNGIPDWVNEEEFANDRCLEFTSDSQMLVWVRYDESQVPQFSFALYRGMAPERSQYATYPGAYEYKYPVAGERNATVTAMSYDIKAHTTRTLKVPLEDDGYIPRVFATADPDKVAVVTLNRHQDQMDIYMANPRSTECQLAVRDNVDKYISEDAYNAMVFAGQSFYMCSERDGYNHIYEYALNGQLRRQLTTGATIVTAFYGIDPKSGDAFYQAHDKDDPTRSYIYKVDKKGSVTNLTPEQGTHKALFSASMRYFIHTYSNLNTPYLTTICDAKGKTLATLEDNKQVLERTARFDVGTRELFTFTTSEGVRLNGIMVKPRDFDPAKRYPVIMSQYSGPGSQRVLDKWPSAELGEGSAFEFYMCQQGFICVSVDGRGTGGRGADFERCTYLRLGQLEAADQVETALYLGSLPYIDSSHIGIWGWSFGGFCTLMSMSEGRGAFAAGVAIAAPTDWRYYDTIYTERFMRTPNENPDGYDCNPITRAPQLQGDLLLIHGLADDNVHFRNAAEYAESLVQADKDFRELLYTNRNHSIYGGRTRSHLTRQVASHFLQMIQ